MYSIIKFEDRNDNREILAHGWARKDDNSPMVYIFQRSNKDGAITTFVDGAACPEEAEQGDFFDIRISVYEDDYTFDQGTAAAAVGWSVSEVKVGKLTPFLSERPAESKYVSEITAGKIETKKPGLVKRFAKKLAQAIIR